MFSVFGEISSLKINTDDKGMPIGEAFVCFVESSSAEEAIKQMNKKKLGNDQILIVQRHIKK